MNQLATARVARVALAGRPSSSLDTAIESECARLARKYPAWMTAADIAIEEDCSVRTAQRRLEAGRYGAVDVLPDGARRVLTQSYLAALRRRTQVFTATA